ncbi:MFS transporter [Arthrobacter sp. GCM10027362]|uniref:MFS transporter n=1 Tax=Arthrobacter sp. GCM10027362 TaxID=3273379 RepID=UPI00362B8BFC
MSSNQQTTTAPGRSPETNPASTPAPQQWSARQLRSRRPVLAAMICVALVGALQGVDPALHSVAMPQAAKELGMDPAAASFIKSIGTIVLAASMLGVGIVGDRHGRRKALVAGTLLMAVAAVVTATAASPLVFGLGRAMMGLATATSFAMCLAFIPTLYPREQLPKAFGLFFGAGASLIVASTALSGTIQGLFGWRATYLATAALCLVLGLAAWQLLPENRAAVLRRFDAPGVALAGAGLVALVYSIGRASALGWGHPLVLGGLGVAAVILAAFTVWELRCQHPAFPVELFRLPGFTAACLAGVLFNWADASLLGQYPALALPAGVPAAAVSVIVALMYFGMICGAPAAGLAQNRFGLSNRTMFTSGLLLCAAGLAIQVLLQNPHDLLLPAAGLFVVGFAVMWMQNPQSAVIMGSAPADQLGAVGAVKPAVGQFGFGLGFALAGPIAGIFTSGPTLTAHAYGLGLATQAAFFILAAGLVFVLLKPRPAA